MFSVPVRNQTDNRSTDSMSQPYGHWLLLPRMKEGRKQSWVLCPSTMKWSWGDGGATEDIHQQKNRPTRNPVGGTKPMSYDWLRPTTGRCWMLTAISRQAGRSVAGLTSIFFGGLFFLPHALASQHEGFSSCRWGVAKGLQCVAFLIKTLLHSHNVIDTCPNPNNIRYRSTCGSGWLHRLYGFYDFTSFKQEGKEVQVWHDRRGRSWQLQASARVQAGFPSLIPHLNNSPSIKSFGQWTLQVCMVAMSPPPLPCPTLCHSYN